VLAALLAIALQTEPAAEPVGPIPAAAPTVAPTPTAPSTGPTIAPLPSGPRSDPLPLPPPPGLGSPFAAPAPAAAGERAPDEVASLLGPGRALVEARQVDLDLDGHPEWILVASYLHPDRMDYGPRSAEWRGGQRIESRATHELVIARRERGAWAVRFTAELRGSERQALFVERLARADGRPPRLPVVITGARACVGSCGPVELHLVLWDARRKAFADYAWAGAEFVQLTPAGAVEAWFADRRAGDPVCCPSGYTVMELAVFDGDIDVRRQRSVPADQLRRLLPPGKLIERSR
jgi:hypothetical protein